MGYTGKSQKNLKKKLKKNIISKMQEPEKKFFFYKYTSFPHNTNTGFKEKYKHI